jgi:zinc/manganese transport system substrate-binding protein
VPRVRTAAAVLAGALLAALALTGCSVSSTARGAAVASGNPAVCPGKVVDVVVSVSQWSDLAERLGGACATVTTVLASPAVDPHDFEPGTAAIAAFSDARLVVVNGAGYDQWALDALGNLDPRPVAVSAAAVAAVRPGANPHLWYSPAVVARMARTLTARLRGLSPAAAGYFTERQAAWARDLRPYLDEVARVKRLAIGHSYAATETVFDNMATAVGLTDATPEGFRRASSNGSEPAPGDLAAFRTALRDGAVDVLVYNTQTSGTVPEELRAAAVAAGVPVLDVTESPPSLGGSFLSWQTAQLQRLSADLGGPP